MEFQREREGVTDESSSIYAPVFITNPEHVAGGVDGDCSYKWRGTLITSSSCGQLHDTDLHGAITRPNGGSFDKFMPLSTI